MRSAVLGDFIFYFLHKLCISCLLTCPVTTVSMLGDRGVGFSSVPGVQIVESDMQVHGLLQIPMSSFKKGAMLSYFKPEV